MKHIVLFMLCISMFCCGQQQLDPDKFYVHDSLDEFHATLVANGVRHDVYIDTRVDIDSPRIYELSDELSKMLPILEDTFAEYNGSRIRLVLVSPTTSNSSSGWVFYDQPNTVYVIYRSDLQRAIAHELTHAIQFSGGYVMPKWQSGLCRMAHLWRFRVGGYAHIICKSRQMAR